MEIDCLILITIHVSVSMCICWTVGQDDRKFLEMTHQFSEKPSGTQCTMTRVVSPFILHSTWFFQTNWWLLTSFTLFRRPCQNITQQTLLQVLNFIAFIRQKNIEIKEKVFPQKMIRTFHVSGLWKRMMQQMFFQSTDYKLH